MKTNAKGSTNVLMYLAVAVVLVAVLWFGLSGSRVPATTEEGKAVAIGYNSAVCKEVIRADGSKEDLGCKQNLFTNYGKNLTRDSLGLGSLAAVTAIGVANVTGITQAATDVSLGGEYGANPPSACGIGRAAGSYAIVSTSHGNWSISKVFTSTCDALPVNGTGLYNATSGNNLFAETTFTTATLQTNDQINVTWYIWVT